MGDGESGGGDVEVGDERKMLVVYEHKEEKVLYPRPIVSHEEVVRSHGLFLDALRRFHAALGTRFMIPVIGGKDLDLHLLYVQVTQRGGLEKVIGERRWREVISAFKFPPTTTSASFVLRKYYISLLHHFEQVYYFGLQGPLVPPAAILQTKSPSPKLHSPSSDAPVAKDRKRPPIDFRSKGSAPVSFTVSGTIDGKFEHGYLVSVRMGTEILRGVLFHTLHHQPQPFAVPIPCNAIAPYASPMQTQRRRRRGWRSRDPSHPKPNRSAYNFFFAEQHSKLKVLYPHREREFSKMIGESWNKLTEEERKVYNDCGRKDKERYRKEKQEYKERLKLVNPMDSVVRFDSSRGV